MSQVSYLGDLVKEYLIFRGFNGTVKLFDQELKNSQDKGLRIDKVLDQLMGAIISSDLVALRDQWSQLCTKVFSRLEAHMAPTVKKMETSLYRRYLVHAVLQGRSDKVVEFFEKMRPEIQGQAEWREWFALPFTKNPEDLPAFSPYFNRHWQDTLSVSLHNFLAITFQSLPMPRLCSFDEEVVKMKSLSVENEGLRLRMSNMEAAGRDREGSSQSQGSRDSSSANVPVRDEIMDDFSALARESSRHSGLAPSKSTSSNVKAGASNESGATKGFRGFIRNISSGGMGSSSHPPPPAPHVPARTTSVSATTAAAKQTTDAAASSGQPSVAPDRSLPPPPPSPSATSAPPTPPAHQTECPQPQPIYARPVKAASNVPKRDAPAPPPQSATSSADASKGTDASKSPFLLLSQEEYREHKAGLTSTLFDPTGSLVASADSDGIVKIWSCTPFMTQASVVSKEGVSSLCWHGAHLLIGTKGGRFKLHDVKRLVKCEEKGKDKRIVCFASPLSATSGQETLPSPSSSAPSLASKFALSIAPTAKPGFNGKLVLWDAVAWAQESDLTWDTSAVVTTCSFRPTSSNTVVAGLSDGTLFLIDTRASAQGAPPTLLSNPVHPPSSSGGSGPGGEIIYLQVDRKHEEQVFTLNGKDGLLTLWDARKPGCRVWDYQLIPKTVYSGIYSKLFALGKDETAIAVHENGSAVYKVLPTGMEPVHRLGGHTGSVTTALDWSVTMNCRTVVTGSRDARVKVSMLLSP